MSERAPQRPSSGAKKSASASGRSQRQGDNGDGGARRTPNSSSSGGRKRDVNLESGIIVTVKEEFGFIKSFTRPEDAFFHYDELHNREDAAIGNEVTFSTRVSTKSGRETCVNLRVLRNGSFLAEAGDYSRLPTIGAASLERGEVVFVGEKSGVFLTLSRQVAVFDVTLVQGGASKLVKKGLELACKVVRDPATGICIAIPPFQSSESALEIGMVRKLTVQGGSNKLAGVLKWGASSSDIGFDWTAPKNSPEIREGDWVWFKLDGTRGTRATDLVLCTPKGEMPYFQAQAGSGALSEGLQQWLEEDVAADIDQQVKRGCGTIAAVREGFAFIKPDRSGDNLFMPLSELCISRPMFRRSEVTAGEFVTFETKKNTGDKGSDVAVRAFVLLGLNKESWKRSKEVLIAKGVSGRVANAGAKSVKTIEYDAASVATAEAPEIWNALKTLKQGEVYPLGELAKGARFLALAIQYCKWLGLDFDTDSARATRTTNAQKNVVIPCQSHDQGEDNVDLPTFEVGGPVVFDLYFDTITSRRFAIVVPEVLPSRDIVLPEGERETGVIASLNPPWILSTRRETKLKPASGESLRCKVGDGVSFIAEESRYGATLLAKSIEAMDLGSKADLLGLSTLFQTRVKGVILREAPKANRSEIPTVVSLLQSSYSTGPRSGLIAVGRDEEVIQQVARSTTTKESDSKTGTLDWRRENELLRVVRACKDRQEASEDDPLHVFRGLVEEERRSVEKEVKKQGLVAKASTLTNEYCIARTKASASVWASKVGKRVRVPPFGEGVVLDVRTREALGVVYHVGLFPNSKGVYGARLYCVHGGPSTMEFLDDVSGGAKEHANQKEAEGESLAEVALSAVRAWVHQGVVPPQALKVMSPTRVLLPDSPPWVDACVSTGLLHKRGDERLLAVCDTSEPADVFSSQDLTKFMGNFAFAIDTNQSTCFMPIEGDLVEFTPCLSTATGIIRAATLSLVTAAPGRLSGEVEELTSKGGWVRPKGKLSAEFYAVDLVNRSVSVGDLVDFYLSDKGDRATKVRLLQSNPKRPSSAPPATGSSTSAQSTVQSPAGAEAVRPRINQELISNAPNASSAAASNQAPGPDGTIGFTQEKWRNKRQVPTIAALILNPAASDLMPVPVLNGASASASAVNTPTKGSKKKIRADAPEFVPGGMAKPVVPSKKD